MTQPKTLNYLRDRFTDLSTKARDINEKIKTAKTQLKKDFYMKKLMKVNTQALDILVLLNASQEAESLKETENANKD